MPEEDNAALVARFLDELWNKKNVAIVDELLADTYVDHTPPRSAGDQEPQGREAVKQVFEALHLGLSDIHVSIEDQIAEEDEVMTRVTWECTLKSNDPSTASPFTVMGVGVDRIDDGKIVEDWNTLDVLYRLLNLLPQHFRAIQVPCDPKHPCKSGFRCQSGFCQRAP